MDDSFLITRSLVFRLLFAQIIFQCAQAGIPILPVLPYPIRYFAQPLQPGFTEPFPSPLLHDNEAAFGKDLDVLVDGCPADREVVGDGIDIKGLGGYQLENFSSGGIGNSLKNISAHNMKPLGFKCTLLSSDYT